MRRARSVRPRRRLTVAFMLAGVVFGIGTLAVLADQWRRSEAGVVVDVRGTEVIDPAAVRELAAAPDTAVLADLDLLAIEQRVAAHPYVRSVVARRDPPRTLVLDVVERTPVALLPGQGPVDRLIDADGIVLPAAPGARTEDLPLITGAPGTALPPGSRARDRRVLDAVRILRTIDSLGRDLPGLFSEIDISRRRDIILYTLESGIPVIFGGADRIAEKLLSFKSFWDTVAMQRAVTDLEYVDVRFNAQVVARLRGTADTVRHAAQADSITITSD